MSLHSRHSLAANNALQLTASSARSSLAPVAGGADAAWRQAAGAASCLAFPACHQRRISGWVTQRTAYRAMVPFCF